MQQKRTQIEKHEKVKLKKWTLKLSEFKLHTMAVAENNNCGRLQIVVIIGIVVYMYFFRSYNNKEKFKWQLFKAVQCVTSSHKVHGSVSAKIIWC